MEHWEMAEEIVAKLKNDKDFRDVDIAEHGLDYTDVSVRGRDGSEFIVRVTRVSGNVV